MIDTKLRTHAKTPPPRSFATARQRPLLAAANPSLVESSWSRIDFSGGSGSSGLFINGPDKDAPKPDAPKTPPKEKTPPPKKETKEKTPDCPTNVEIINLDQLKDPKFGTSSWKTGIGAIAYMQVSGAGRTDWDGTKIQESVKQTKNTCGARARKVCSNESGEAVDFEVGAASNVLGQKKLDALMNTFYDLHIFTHDVSILHEKDIPNCEIQCEQTYKCGGKQVGPPFIITYSATKDTVAKTYDVSRIKVDKQPKATPTAAPANPKTP